MKRPHLIAELIGLLVTGIFVADASAYYHTGLGQFMGRDPGSGGAVRIGAGIAASVAHFVPRGQYRDGMDLYQYVRGSPVCHVDPAGLYEQPEHEVDTSNAGRALGLESADQIGIYDQGADEGGHDAPTQGVISILTFGILGQDYQWHCPGAKQPNILYLIFGDHSPSNYVKPGFRNDVVVKRIWDALVACKDDEIGRALHTLQDSYSHEGWPERGFHPDYFDPNIGAIKNPGDPRERWVWNDPPTFRDLQTGDLRLLGRNGIGMHEAMTRNPDYKQFVLASTEPDWNKRRWRIENPKDRGIKAVDERKKDDDRYLRAGGDVQLILAEYKRHCCRQVNGVSWKNVGPQP
ncbi:MAG: hypothetical protein ACE15C_13150 [Phycisphaerae bacterium]